ncbi:YibE/F family protein [Streptomyces sp. WMMB 322]|uniref:YibE/F family protein n=1 Tax=Streptomyces sp. WMMB 322 TaxID=1286821 RepID=UPI0008239EE5|nr:YibE/F family protein [Streptomyces sp. WMMB 322]SCK30386.1 Uncharacterized membrane protein [Streptomyces sp. WMMB 322]
MAAPHPHGHSPGDGPTEPGPRHLGKVIAAVVIPFIVAVAVGILVLWPDGVPDRKRSGVGFDQQTESGSVVRVDTRNCAQPDSGSPLPESSGSSGLGRGETDRRRDTCRTAIVEVTSGPHKGRRFIEDVQADGPRQLQSGQDVVVAYEPSAPREAQFRVADIDRSLPMTLLAGIFALVVVAVGRLRGLLALATLAVSFAVLSFFILPAILHGSNPLAVAVVGSSAIMLVALYGCHGITARTSVAVLGTLVSLLLIGVLGSQFIDWAVLSGNTSEETGLIHDLFPGIDMRGLLLAGVVIGAIGVLDDVTVTQTSAVWELRQANTAMSARQLYKAAMRIGRDHIVSVVNTLVLAYAGAALPLLLLFSVARSSLGRVANSEIVAEEILRTLVGSIGLVASVPITTLLAALVVSAHRPLMGGKGPSTAPNSPSSTP